MPRLFRHGSLIVYIWTNEGKPLEPIHVHIAHECQSERSDKFWLSKYGYFIADKGNKVVKSRVAEKILESFVNLGGVDQLLNEWKSRFGEGSVRYIDD